MEEIKKIKSNTFFSALSISSRLIANVIVFWIIARFYSPELFGQFTFAHTLATTFIIFADFGLDVLLTKEIAQKRKDASQIFQNLFSIKIILTSLAMIGMWTFAFVFNFNFLSQKMIFIFSFFLVFTTLTNYLYALYKGFEVLEYETKVSLIMNIGLLFIIAFLLLIKADIIIIATGFVLSRLIGFLIGIRYSFKVLPWINYRFILSGFTNFKNEIFIFGFHFLFSYLFFTMDTILIGLLKGDYDVGLYQAVFKLIMLPIVIPEIFVNVLLPVLTRLNITNKVQWEKLGALMSKIQFIIVIPTTLSLYLYSDQIINFIYGSNYSDSVPVLKVFAIILFIRFCLEPFALMLTTSNRQKFRMYIVIIATLLNLVFNIYFIPKYGILGASIISLFTNTFVAVCFFISLPHLFRAWLLSYKTISLLVVSFILLIIFLKLFILNFIFGIPILFIIYFIVALFYYFSKEERNVIFSMDFVSNYFNKNRWNHR